MKVAIDPGHGNYDPGATGRFLEEKNVVLDIALLLRDMCKEAGHEVIMTREEDRFVTLSRRSKIANENRADLFISIHANGHKNNEANGLEVFHYFGSIKGEKLATHIQNQMVENLKRRDRGVKRNRLAVLYMTKMPAVLVEVGFITNDTEEELMNTCMYRYLAAKSIFRGLTNYIRRYYNVS